MEKWTSVDEGLPAPTTPMDPCCSETVLVFTDHTDMALAEYCHNDKAWHICGTGWGMHVVTHWMSLPKRPQL